MSTTPKIAVRRPGRAAQPNQRFISPGQAIERPQHCSATPMDATAWSLRYLQRQDARHQPWFKHLDFVKVGEEDIKKLFWVPSTDTSPSQAIERPGHCSDTPIEATVDHNAISGGERGSGHTTINHLGLSSLVPQWL